MARKSASKGDEREKHCATCTKGENDGATFGSDPYHCLSCIRARIAKWRAAKKAAALAASAPVEPAEAPAPESKADEVRVSGPMSSRDLMVAVNGSLALTGEGWIAFANRAGVAPALVHSILNDTAPAKTEAEVAERLMVAIGG